MGLELFLGLIRTVNRNLGALSGTYKSPDPVDPNGSHGPKSALEGNFVVHINNVMVVRQAINQVGPRDPVVAEGRAA